MGFAFFWISAKNSGQGQSELNNALQTRRVLSIEKHFCQLPPEPGWAIAVEFLDGASPVTSMVSGTGRKEIDYREVLAPETFGIYSGLRALRKELATAAAIPAYSVLTNAQLAEIAQTRCDSLDGFRKIKGVGDSQTEKYGTLFIDRLRELTTGHPQPSGGPF